MRGEIFIDHKGSVELVSIDMKKPGLTSVVVSRLAFEDVFLAKPARTLVLRASADSTR